MALADFLIMTPSGDKDLFQVTNVTYDELAKTENYIRVLECVTKPVQLISDAFKTSQPVAFEKYEIFEKMDKFKRKFYELSLPNILMTNKGLQRIHRKVLEKECKILDFGCGSGTSTISLARIYHRFVSAQLQRCRHDLYAVIELRN